MLVNYFQLFGAILLFPMVVDLAVAERRYCGLALTKKLTAVCESTDCSKIEKSSDDSHTDEISSRCCRFGCETSHMEQFCCLSNTNGNVEQDNTSTMAPEESPFRPKKSSKKHSTEYYRNLKFKQMKRALEKWAEAELDSLA
uniref:Insulin-like domain-containing protein n=1 Tax=Acrobeloides nanus TaxID=290746 RepID=A0A914CYI7_9BILA